MKKPARGRAFNCSSGGMGIFSITAASAGLAAACVAATINTG